MPKLKASPGRITLQTPLQDEFQRWLCYELENCKAWNSGQVTGGMVGLRQWKYELPGHWTISWSGGPIFINSTDPIVFIRKGLQIRMGQGRLELE
jgi:hypothetical protein